MRSFYINPQTNDLDFDGSNNLKMIDGDEELLQRVRLNITTRLSEWFLNSDFGFDWAVVQTKSTNYENITSALYAAILFDEEIEVVDDVQFLYDPLTRHLNIDFSFTKVDGQLIEGSLEI